MSSKESTPWEAVVRVSCILAPLLLAGLPSSASGDALDQWHWRNPIPSSVGFEGLAFGRSRFVGVGNGGWILSSTDANAWSTTYAGFRMSFNNVVSSDHGFLAFGYADGEGVVLTSPDGSRWSHHAVPEAAWMLDAAFADGLFVGVARVHTSNSGPLIATSTDGLRWTTLDLVSLPTVDLRGVAHGNGTWVAVGNNGLILTSPDGIEWSVSDSGTPRDLADIAFGGGRFVAVGHRANVSIALVSSDGLEWTTTLSRTNGSPTSPGNLDLDRVAAGTGGFVAIGAGSSALFSVDGETWTEHPLGQVILRGGVAFGDGRWAAGGYALSESRAFTTALSTSTDGMQWTNRTAGVSSATQNGIAFGDGVYVAVGSDARIARSTNGVDWSLVPHGLLGYDLRRVFHVGGRFLALGSQGNTPSLLVSEQGREWTSPVPSVPSGMSSAAFGNGRTVVVGGSGVLVSSNGYDWEVSPSTTASNLLAVAFGGGQFVATGQNGTIQTSSDGGEWTTRRSPTVATLRGLVHDGSTYVAVGSGVILASTNAVDWEVVHAGDFNLTAVSYGAGWFVAVGVTSGGISAVALLTSPDGRRWAPREMGGNLAPRCLAFDGRSFLLGGAGGAILQSDPVASFLSPSLAVRWAGELELLLTGEAGRRYRIESTADLGTGIAWVPLGAVVAESKAVRVPTTPAVGVSRQFYRARLEP